MEIRGLRKFPVKDRWTIHSYYTLNPYAPDGSGRILCAGADPDSGIGEVQILDRDGRLIDRFGKQRVSGSFWHTGFWQAWGPEGRTVYYQSSDGDPLHPRVTMRELDSGREWTIDADMEGVPRFGEPFLYGMCGIYYAAGYADGKYHPELSPIPFGERNRHGLFRAGVKSGKTELVLSVGQLLGLHPLRERLLAEDEKYDGGLTLMVYCVRYSRDGRRVMFHFGNHCTDRRRGEPHILSLFTADCDPDGEIGNIACALDLSFEKKGVHWSWAPDGESLIGYYSSPELSGLAGIDKDGGGMRLYSDHPFRGGHPSICPADPTLIVTDGPFGNQGRLLFLKDGRPSAELAVPKYSRPPREIPAGRNQFFVCHHPVFDQSGTRVLFNALPGRNAELWELELSL